MTLPRILFALRRLAGAALAAATFGAMAAARTPDPAPGAASTATPSATIRSTAPMHVPDTIGQRVAACIACHGREGASGDGGYYPRLSGKPEGYLFNQLRSFRDGRRFNSDMTHMVQHLSDDYLHEIAAYFSALDLPYPPAPASNDATPAMLARGRELVWQGDAARGIPACAQCHGLALTGVAPAIPGLVGLPRLYLSSQLGAWLTDARHALPPDCMATVGAKLNTADVNAVTSWLALQPVPADSRPAPEAPGPLPLPCSAAMR